MITVKRSVLKLTKHGECGIVGIVMQLIYNGHYDKNLKLVKL